MHSRQLTLDTDRLRLRTWREDDRDAFAAMNAHPEVMRDYGGPISREDSDAKFDRYAGAFDVCGFGRWLIETAAGDYLGYCGVMPAYPGHPLGDHHEIGWRLVRHAWGYGYATEAARAALKDVFGRIGLDEVLAYTAPDNLRSQAVMARLNLERDPCLDFVAMNDLVGEWQGLVWVARAA
ncbi:MAG: GNAT family N-acetyltransferase [Pseudomonadales bacterium]|jgi:RimJ/RimL family protein N-acetyltransferase